MRLPCPAMVMLFFVAASLYTTKRGVGPATLLQWTSIAICRSFTVYTLMYTRRTIYFYTSSTARVSVCVFVMCVLCERGRVRVLQVDSRVFSGRPALLVQK